jgi:hypothetical protein
MCMSSTARGGSNVPPITTTVRVIVNINVSKLRLGPCNTEVSAGYQYFELFRELAHALEY